MKATNQKLLRLLLLPQADERRLNSIKEFLYKITKAGLLACLFICGSVVVSDAAEPEWKFDVATRKAYELALNLQFDQVHAQLPQPQTAQEHYATALAEALELLINEDNEKFGEYEDRFEARLERKTKPNNVDDLFLQAEIRMQWAFVYFKFGHEFDAALNLRQAYLTTQEIKKRHPKFLAINKTSSLLDIIIGSVPEKYDWILSLLSIEGTIELGLGDLEKLRISDHDFKLEADMLYALIQGFVLQHPEEGMKVIDQTIAKYPENALVLFLGGSLAIKNSQSELALGMLNKLGSMQNTLPVYYADYLKGEVYLHRAEYLNAITSYRWFINHYKGQNNIKDANYKIGLSYWLNGNVNDAQSTFKIARTVGKELTEADKYASRSLAETELPHPLLTKARYFTDGGYYGHAQNILDSIGPEDLQTVRDEVELNYRKARLYHKMNNLADAKIYYGKTVELNGNSNWYFAPNACLQLGYIMIQENNKVAAEEYFERALSYKKHEYKNSIDTKAKTAMAQLKRK
jgi:TolA-binding protein